MEARNRYALHVFLDDLNEAVVASLHSTPAEELRSKMASILNTSGLRDDLFRLDHDFCAAVWESSVQTQSPVENLSTWCPELRGNVHPVPLAIGGTGIVVWRAFSVAFAEKSAPRTCYDHLSSFGILGLTVLKLDKIERCMSTVCPLSIHDWYQTSISKSEKKTYAKWVPVQIQWLKDLQSTFPPKAGDPVSRLPEDYLYGTKKHKLETIRLIDDFSAALTMLSIATRTQSASEEDMLL